MSRNVLNLWRCIIPNIMYRTAPEKMKESVYADVCGYIASDGIRYKNKVSMLDSVLLSDDKTFRNVFYYRFREHRLLCSLSRLFLPDIKEIELYGEIGKGLHLSHNHLVVHVAKAGDNLHVEAGTVVGKNNGKYPTIGDNVSIGANSTVIGGITIGDNVVIKAGSVVTKSLDKEAVYEGNPAHIVTEA